MRIVNLNGTYYEIKGEISQRAINPWTAKISSGSTTYQDFSNASLEEYFDFRNGIGLKRGEGSEARLDWSEGIDFTSQGQAVLGSLVTTAGAFGVAPVKIIDFQGATYAIGDNKISKWNTADAGSWDSVDTSLDSPIDAIVIADDTDEYLIVSSAIASIYTIDGTNWLALNRDLLLYTEVDANGKLTVTATKATGADVDSDEDVYLYEDKGTSYFNALDIDFELYIASTSVDASFGGMAITNTVNDISGFATTDISVTIRRTVGAAYQIYLARGADVATDNYIGSADTLYYCTLTRVAGNDSVSVTVYSDAGRGNLLDTITVAGFSTTKYRYAFGFVNYNKAAAGKDWDGYVQNLDLGGTKGYLADYANRLYSIATDGKRVNYSAAKDIDKYGGNFNLTGNYGTVYDLFEGKLLADGSPALYFCGTQGLYSIDVTNQIAYKQEVEYPPLTYSGHKGIYWNGSVWVATGYGILKVTPSMATYIGSDLDDGLPSGYQGYIYDMVTVNNWLVYAVNCGASGYSSIIKRNSSYGGNLQVYTGASNAAIPCLCHSPSSLYTNGRLWFGEGTNVKYMMFPDTTSNVKQIATYTYVDDSGYGTFPIFRKMAVIPKVALGVGAITKSCVDASNEYIEVFYGLNGAAATTSLGTFLTSPHPTVLTFNSGLGTEFYTIQFAIKLYRKTASTTNSPELESLLFYWYAVPNRINSWTFNVIAVGDNSDKTFTDLETIYDTTTLVTFYPSGDTAKSSYKVKMTHMPSREYWENQGRREGVIQITLQEVCNL